ncbi:MAG: hypothetical protein JNK82_28535 [Myxococcaceae bacterium]|nr:hypothetical protein [Myxococcaceae bacterium]
MTHPWRPIVSFSLVAILASALFFITFLVSIAPRFALMFADLGGELPVATRIALTKAAPLAALLFLGVGTAAGLARPNERAIVLSLTAGGGLALAFAAMISLYAPIFLLAGQIK